MIKLKTKFMLLLLTGTLTFSSCYGPCQLTRNLHEWNGTVGDEWVNSLVFFGMLVIPVYEVAFAIDAVILNTVEFWTGDNPVGMNKNQRIEKTVENENGTYKVIATKNRYIIKAIEGPEKGKVLRLKIDDKTRSLYLEQDEEMIKIAQFDEELAQVSVFKPNGETVTYDAANVPLAIK